MGLQLGTFCVGLAALFAFAQLTAKPQSRQILAAIFFGSLALFIAYLLFFSERLLQNFPILFMSYVPATVLGAVSLFLYFSLYLEGRELEPSDGIHGIPIAISLAIYIAFLGISPSQKVSWIHDLYNGKGIEFFLPFTLFSSLVSAIYLIKIMRLNPDYYSFDIKRRPGLTGGIILATIVLGSLLAVATVSVSFAIVVTHICLTIVSVVFLLGTAIHLRDPSVLSTWIADFRKTYQKRNYLNEINVSDVHSRLLGLMNHYRLFTDNELTLNKLADRLSISRYQLSQLLNVEMKTSFSRFIQTYRIQTAQDYLDTYPNRTILSIAYEVGFNSNSSFQSAFKHLVGMTPSEYRSRRKSPDALPPSKTL